MEMIMSAEVKPPVKTEDGGSISREISSME